MQTTPTQPYSAYPLSLMMWVKWLKSNEDDKLANKCYGTGTIVPDVPPAVVCTFCLLYANWCTVITKNVGLWLKFR